MKALIPIVILVLFSGCKTDVIYNQDNPPIVLGDSNSIVTETDSKYLQNNISDYEIDDSEVVIDFAKTDTIAKVDTVKKVKETQSFSGYAIDVNGSKIILENVKDNAITPKNDFYIISRKNLPKSLQFQNLKNVQVKQRYVSKIAVTTSQGEIDLSNAGYYTSQWEKVNVKNNAASLNVINDYSFQNMKKAKLQSLISEAIDKSNYKKSAKNKLKSELKSISTIQDKNIIISPLKVEYQVTGQNESGKSINKIISFSI